MLLLCAALAGCAGSGGSSRQPWIKKSQLATLPGSTVQVVVPSIGVEVESDPDAGAKRMRVIGAGMSAIPGVGILGAIALGGATGAANKSYQDSQQQEIQSRSALYLAVMGNYELAPLLSPRLEKALRTSPNFQGTTYREPASSMFRGSPLNPDSAQTVVEGWANVSDDEDEAVVRANVRIGSPDKRTLWHEYSYRSTVSLADLVGPSLKQELRGKDANTQRSTRRALWLADQGKLLNEGLAKATADVAIRIAYDLGAPWPEDNAD
ncbi:hypothetical protein RT97_28105 [Variovorax paradoxus]|uniref:Uncharacterized protein n=1 Tax=Variovorax paradoxus TaxID=34073 RepID=A0A0D0LSN0_VARPD|nr:hypothetical protein [Variovorax paradoxus]KIQ20520.1 hypothetical protein RT97_28105 [Variovorax paradoxus]